MNSQDDEVTKLRENLELSHKKYLALADVIAAGSESHEHLLSIALAMRNQRDEAIDYLSSMARLPDFACRCGRCVPSAYNSGLCEFTRLKIQRNR